MSVGTFSRVVAHIHMIKSNVSMLSRVIFDLKKVNFLFFLFSIYVAMQLLVAMVISQFPGSGRQMSNAVKHNLI